MAADAIGANEHQRVNGIARGLLTSTEDEFDAFRPAPCRLIFSPIFSSVSAHCPSSAAHQIAVGTHRPVRLFPRGALRAFNDVRLLVFQALEEGAPLGIDEPRDRPRIWRTGLRCKRHCRRRGTRYERRWRWRPGGTWRSNPCAAEKPPVSGRNGPKGPATGGT